LVDLVMRKNADHYTDLLVEVLEAEYLLLDLQTPFSRVVTEERLWHAGCSRKDSTAAGQPSHRSAAAALQAPL